jgi:hypothetical protein
MNVPKIIMMISRLRCACRTDGRFVILTAVRSDLWLVTCDLPVVRREAHLPAEPIGMKLVGLVVLGRERVKNLEHCYSWTIDYWL